MTKSVKFLGVTASIALLAACGGGESEPAADTAATAPAATTAAAPEPAAEAPAVDNTETLDGTTLAEFTPDVAHGGEVFAQCQTCHVLEEGVNRVGPSLAGIVGRAAGTVEGYTYSDANKNSGITWTKEKLFQYLEKPQRVIPGTKMAFAGLPAGQDRADVIAYLESGGQ
ncbi:cytochrome c family protein [Qipengyuania sp. 6B39]|uniref:c-type cytochrome n=1 Tax=Qipengyuania proteolytica TaxID=2867239 RepID=UPI001C89AC96|nr:cytochrome c family protein [Qipengyuania proteolytica]MBX7497109.1 cytochrome c family protein [Qipengyuania proteolytica]